MKKTKLLLAFILLLALVGCKKKEPPKPPVVVDPDVESVEITNTETTLGVGSHVITARALPEGSSQLLRITLVGTFEGVSIDDSTLTISPETQDKLEITVRVTSLYDPTKSNTKVFTVDNQIDYVEIRTEADLRAIETSENGLSKNYLLMNHIELTGEWDPIGVADKELDDGSVVKGNPFMGIFNGQGYTISGIKMSEGEFNEGFFAQIGPGGVVRNVTLKGNISAIGWTGGVAGINEGKISNVAAHIDVSVQNTSAAALVCVNRGVIEYSYATGKTTSSLPLSSPRSAGLMVINEGTLNNVYGDKDTIESPNYLSGSPVADDLYMLSTALMKTASTFSSFDTDIWFLKDGFYPLLKHEGFVEPTEKEKSLVVNNENLIVNAVLENEVVIDVTLVNGDLEDVLVYTLKEEVLGVSIAGNVVSLTTEVVHLSTFTVVITLEGTEISREVTFTVRNNPDSANTVVEIRTEEEFLALQGLDSDSAEYTYKLMNDIALTGWYTQTIGNAEIPFMGTFDGQGFTISGFQSGGEGSFSIFGYIGKTGVVKNLGIRGRSQSEEPDGVTNDFYWGANSAVVATENKGLIENLFVQFKIMSPTAQVAGIVADNQGTVRYVVSRVTASKDIDPDGGPAPAFALTNTGTISNIKIDADYTGAKQLLAMPNPETDAKDGEYLLIHKFYAASTYADFDPNIWLIREDLYPRLKNENLIRVYNTRYFVNAVKETGVIIDADVFYAVPADNLTYSLKEAVTGVSIAGNQVTVTTDAVHLSTFTVVITLQGTDVSKEVVFTVRNNPTSCAEIVEISTEAQLNALLVNGNEEAMEKNYKLTADITLEGFFPVPIGSETNPFFGTFDGQGHTITGFQSGEVSNFGIFGVIGTNGVVKNLGLKGRSTVSSLEVDFYHYDNSAFVASVNYGTIENIYIEGVIQSPGVLVAGIVAHNYGTITNVVSQVKVIKATNQIGPAGVLTNTGTITNVFINKGVAGETTFLPEASTFDSFLYAEVDFKAAVTYTGILDPTIWEIVDGEVPKLKPQI